jgi:hypothetical protein
MMAAMRLLLLLLLLLPAPALAGRVALVIGNSAYTHAGVLPNAASDAADMADTLAGLGFQVYGGTDMDHRQMLEAVEAFSGAIAPEDLALFYYAGHGAQIGAENYVIPVDVQASDEVTLAAASVRLGTILRTMELRADRRIVILDACRNNPFLQAAASRSGGDPARGLARVEAGVGSYIAFSTQPGNIALDGQGRNSPFTAALLRHIGEPGADIHEVMRRVRSDVVQATGQTQVPWENSSLVDQVFLAAADTPATPPPEPQPAPAPAPEAAANPFAAAPAEPAPALQRLTPPAPSGRYHYVGGLDPKGDGFLALRAGTSGNAPRLARMPEGTLLTVLASDGVWRFVRLLDGREGWAHANWILCCTSADAAPEPPPPPPPPAPQPAAGCADLWYARNAIFASYGYCFTSPEGQQAFGNAGCFRTADQVRAAMSGTDRARVERLRNAERTQGCR